MRDRPTGNYADYERIGDFAPPGGARPAKPHAFTYLAELWLTQRPVSGGWTMEDQAPR